MNLVAFDMYDVDNDGLISKDELLIILHMMVGANIRYTYYKIYNFIFSLNNFRLIYFSVKNSCP